MNENKVPQDIQDAADKLYPIEQKLFVNHPHPHDIHVIERQHYIQGRINERTAHTPVSRLTQEEVEKMAHNVFPQGSTMPIGSKDRALYEQKKESYIAGYNAANTVCSTVEQHPVQVDSRIQQK